MVKTGCSRSVISLKGCFDWSAAAWMVQAMKISWHELPRGDKPAFDSLVDAICPAHLGLPDVLWAIRPRPRKLYRKPCCVCGLTRRAGDPPPRSAPGSIGWSLIYVLTANGALRLRALKGAPEPADPRPDPLRELESGELEHTGWPRRSAGCLSASVLRLCSPIMKGCQMRRPPRCSAPRSRGLKRYWCEPDDPCAKPSGPWWLI